MGRSTATWLVAGLQDLLSTATAVVELPVTRPDIGIGKLVLDLLVVIAHAAPVMGVVLPIPAVHVVPVDVHVLVDIDVNVAVTPIEVIVPDGIADGEAAPQAMPRASAPPTT